MKEAKGKSPLKKMAKEKKRAWGELFDAAIEKVTSAQHASDQKFLEIEEKRLKMEEKMMGQLQSTLALMSGMLPQVGAYSQPYYPPIPPLHNFPPPSDHEDQGNARKDN